MWRLILELIQGSLYVLQEHVCGMCKLGVTPGLHTFLTRHKHKHNENIPFLMLMPTLLPVYTAYSHAYVNAMSLCKPANL